MSLTRILGDLADYLQHQVEEGERVTECSPALVRSLGQAPGEPPPTNVKPPPPTRPPSGSPSRDTRASATGSAPTSAAPVATASATAPYRAWGSTPELDVVAQGVMACTRCGLCRTRRQAVPGQGNPRPELVFVGEGPGEDEDDQGLAFVGRSGQLVTRLIAAMGLQREDVWIGNVVKCRPPENRPPTPDEMKACLPYLRDQLALLKPKVIVALGTTAVTGLLGPDQPGITKLRGHWQRFANIDLMPTYHPSYLLRGGGEEKARYWEVWEDMTEVLRRLGRPVPERQRKSV